jgi:hypothetical protein
LSLLLLSAACGDDDGGIPDHDFGTVSDSIGADPSGTGSTEPDGADETGVRGAFPSTSSSKATSTVPR